MILSLEDIYIVRLNLEDISVTKVKKEHTDVHCVIFKAVATPRENLSALGFSTRSIKNCVVQPQKTSTIFRKERNCTIYSLTYKPCGFLKARFIKLEHVPIRQQNYKSYIVCVPSEDSDQP